VLKVKHPEGYPPEKGRYVRGNDYSPVAVCVVLDTFDFAIPSALNELVMTGADNGAALSGLLQTENIGIEKIICNIVANPNIRYIILCGRESTGHMPGESLLTLKQNGVDEQGRIIGSTALMPQLSNVPLELVERFRKQVVTVVNLLCKPGEKDLSTPGLNAKIVEKAIWSCFQESPVEFMGLTLYDIGAYPEPAIVYQIVSKLGASQTQQAVEPGKLRVGMGLTLHKLLPKTDCKQCGRKTCLAFAIDLAKGKCHLEDCPILTKPESAQDREALLKLLA
jgi:tetrahydromethanopterin S-methyltransferase subunit A